jgi:hypothetical protein
MNARPAMTTNHFLEHDDFSSKFIALYLIAGA